MNIYFWFILMIPMMVFGGDLLKPGDPAPEFSLLDSQGKMYKLSDYRGKIVVLYFYPKDDTPGCTAEACNLRDNYDALEKAGLVIFGVSFDDAVSHKKFSEKHNLPFTLLSDTSKTVAEAYGAKGGLTGFIGPKRITYLIDEQGKVLHVFDKVETGDHTRQIFDALEKRAK